MDVAIWVGAAFSVLGLMGLIACIVSVWKARRKQLHDQMLRAHLQRVVAWNLASLMISIIGLGTIVVGILLSP